MNRTERLNTILNLLAKGGPLEGHGPAVLNSKPMVS
jgi:hypothetical protein